MSDDDDCWQGQGQAQQEAAPGHCYQIYQVTGEYHQVAGRKQIMIQVLLLIL